MVSPRRGAAQESDPDLGAGVAEVPGEILADLGQLGISCGIHYPVPLHLQAAYRSLGWVKGAFPVSERCAEEFLSLPMFPELTPDQVEAVVEGLKTVLGLHPLPTPNSQLPTPARPVTQS